MTEDHATKLISLLVSATTGWNDDAVDLTIEMMTRRWTDYDIAKEATMLVIDTWDKQSRPPWAVLNNAYRIQYRRNIMNAPALTEDTYGGPVVSNAEGRKIAAQAYTRECQKRTPDDVHVKSGFRTIEPNWDWFDRIAGLSKHSDEDDVPFLERTVPTVPAPLATPERFAARAQVLDYVHTDADAPPEDIEHDTVSAGDWADYHKQKTGPETNPIAEAAKEVTDRILGEHE
jgi:hypothetical protein